MKATHQARYEDWICTRCNWTGTYSTTVGVMYWGIDWQNCPSCNSTAIPIIGSTERIEATQTKLHLGDKAKFTVCSQCGKEYKTPVIMCWLCGNSNR